MTLADAPHFTIAIEAAPLDSPRPMTSGEPRTPPRGPLDERSVDGQARLVRGSSPAYPDNARALGIEGDVHLEIMVGASGAVEDAWVIRGASEELDEAALRAVLGFHFAPATKAGHAVRARMGWTIQFRLQ